MQPIDTQPIYPFRWDVTRRSQLGSLVGTQEGDKETWLDWQTYAWNSYRWRVEYTYEWFLAQLRSCGARIIAFCDDSDLYFVGRSPDSIFDHMSGLLFDTSWFDRLNLLHFSTGALDWKEAFEHNPSALPAIRDYFTHLGLDPLTLIRRERSVTFVDIVATGDTFGMLIRLLHDWAVAHQTPWSEMKRKIRIIGLTERMKTSPKTWRWQQHAKWVSLLGTGAIKNVSIPMEVFNFLGGGQPKMSRTYDPTSWGDTRILQPKYNEGSLAALRLALSLFDDGRQKAARLEFARELAKQPAMRHSWFRALVQELKS